ncbi:MAG: hypothetical protein CMQ20_01790 [Gammaproteobacteria bacterium]|jgi:hypothetical protein|nr:hypothetical protein [Gammaproteobacteria bacterium]|tara:strand:+ start:8239 stop:9207 length:969 start_codon:yes stop_codon:yes gene_type:complete
MVVKAEDEYRHEAPEDMSAGFWGDTLWVSVVDREANIFGINHFTLTNKGWGRFEALYVIDGVQQQYGNKYPLTLEADQGPWTDGLLTYEVVKPLEEIRITFDGPRFGFDLNFKGRFPVFDYEDSVNGNPLSHGHYYGGHFEQGLHCTGPFEIRGGPCKGETRQLDSWSHRDHSWSTRFADEPPWDYSQQNIANHYWPSIQLADKHINVFGVHQPDGPFGGFISDANGSRAMLSASCEVLKSDNQRDAAAFRYTLEMPDGETIHVRTGRKYGQVKLWDRGENDLENRLDCYEPFFDFEVEETGERGYGVCEYSVHPPWPRWLV